MVVLNNKKRMSKVATSNNKMILYILNVSTTNKHNGHKRHRYACPNNKILLTKTRDIQANKIASVILMYLMLPCNCKYIAKLYAHEQHTNAIAWQRYVPPS